MAIKSADNSSALLHGLRKPLLLTIKYDLQCSVVEYLTTLISLSLSLSLSLSPITYSKSDLILVRWE